MATNTLIQKLFGADESGVGEDSNAVSNRVQHETFRAGEAITAGACVSLDVSASTNGERALIVFEADTADAVPVGVYDSDVDAAAGDYIRVCVKGIVEEALTDGSGDTAIAVGDALIIGGADGKLVPKIIDVSLAADYNLKPTVAIAMEASSADATSRVLVIKNF